MSRGRSTGVTVAALALVLAVAVAVAVVGCGEDDDPTLEALKREQVAALVPPGGTLASQSEDRAHTSLGKPAAARVTRVFAFDDAAGAARGREAAIDTAQASGWNLNLERETVAGAKSLDTGDAMLEIGTYEDGGQFKVSITLEHRACPSVSCPQAASGSSQVDPPDGPYASAAGPYVAVLGTPIEFDGSGSYDPDGTIVSYEWDFDGDGRYDAASARPSAVHTYRAPTDGVAVLRVTDDDGHVQLARARVHVSSDGDEVPPSVDNCPGDPNHGQSDIDGDGIGDVCDPDPGVVLEG